MIHSALALVRRNPDPLAFVIAGVMLIAYELEIFAVTEDVMLGVFMVAAAARSVVSSRSLTEPVAVDLGDGESPEAAFPALGDEPPAS